MTLPAHTPLHDAAHTRDPAQQAQHALADPAHTNAPDKGKHRQREPELDTHLPRWAGPSRYSARHRSLSPTPAIHPSSSPPPPAMPAPSMASSSSPSASHPHSAPSAPSTPRVSCSPRPPLPATITIASSSAASSTSASTVTPTPTMPTSSDPSPSDPMTSTPACLIPLLHCPLCPTSTRLHSPVTLRCGHTLCTSHARPDARGRCPLPTCRSASSAPAVAPHPESHVGYFVGAAGPGAPSVADRPRDGRIDVTVSKIIELVDHAQAWFDDAACGDRVQPAPAYPLDEQTDDEAGDDDEAVRVGPEHDIEDMYLDPATAARMSAAAPTSSFASSNLPGTSTADRTPSPDQRTRRSRSRSPDAPSRPRKRRRRLQHPSRTRHSPPELTERNPTARFEKELLSELTCDICSQLFVQPVTAPCQHTFCAGCLHRSLDYNMACPICRDGLEYTYFQEHPCNRLVLAIILQTFPEAYAERRAAIETEERDARLDTPIMVCQLSYPSMPTMLHFFEPRYRLMLRRCLATPNPRFGMIPPPRVAPSTSHLPAPQQQTGAAGQAASTSTARTNHAPNVSRPASTGNEYGTMLEIRRVQMLADGRAVVETWGAWRFRIVERGTLDGYVVARVERVDDWEEEEEIVIEEAQEVGSSKLSKERTIAQLMEICHEFINELRQGTPWVVQRLDQNFVPMPTDPSNFSFWMGALLPIDEHEKAKLLPIRSARLRLRLVVHWIERLQSQWARSYASASRLQVVHWWMRRQLMRAVFGSVVPAGATGFVVALLVVFMAQSVGRLVNGSA